jgi:hypothetical protein
VPYGNESSTNHSYLFSRIDEWLLLCHLLGSIVMMRRQEVLPS